MAGGAGRLIALVGLSLLLSSAPHDAIAQVFIASQPKPDFTIGPLFVRANVGPKAGPIDVTVLFSVPGETTYDEILKLCGPDPEEREQVSPPGRRTLVYRGRRVVPQRRRRLGWLATVHRWDVEHHEVEIELDGDRVRDVQAQVHRSRLTQPGAA
jgi:hypothetical protein